jgi:hypothetical protein
MGGSAQNTIADRIDRLTAGTAIADACHARIHADLSLTRVFPPRHLRLIEAADIIEALGRRDSLAISSPVKFVRSCCFSHPSTTAAAAWTLGGGVALIYGLCGADAGRLIAAKLGGFIEQSL